MFEDLASVPADPLLGLIEKFRNERNPRKIDLGVGVYKDGSGETTVLPSVKEAESLLLKTQMSKAYVGALGNQGFTQRLTELALGADLTRGLADQMAVLQTPGGCGALRVAAELVARAKPSCKVWVSDPTWANHIPLLGGAGLAIETYPYYDFENPGIKFDAMISALSAAQQGDIVLLHGCCHNPSGADLTEDQWISVVELMVSRGLVPFVDLAYQGFGNGMEEDVFGLRLVMDKCPEAIFAVSCSKNFGLYRDRVGAVGLKLASADDANRAMANITQIVRGIYSMPPDHGGSVVEAILASDTLRQQWVAEVDAMRERITHTRQAVASALKERAGGRFDFVTREYGMFSFLGITEAQVGAMADRYAIYMAPSSRINAAGLNSQNLEYFIDSLASVL